MKKINTVTLALGMVVLLSACSKNEDGSTTVTIPALPSLPSIPTSLPSVNDVTNAAAKLSQLGGLSQSSQEFQVVAENLKNLTPVSNDELKSLIPSTFNSVSRSGYQVSKTLGVARLSAEFKDSDVVYEISIYDGAGEIASNVAAMKIAGMALQSESENEKGYKKSIQIGQAKGIEEQSGKDTGKLKNHIDLVVGNRFLLEMSATGNKADMDSLKAGIKKIKIIEQLEALASTTKT